jgi:hypothetical protein
LTSAIERGIIEQKGGRAIKLMPQLHLLIKPEGCVAAAKPPPHTLLG